MPVGANSSLRAARYHARVLEPDDPGTFDLQLDRFPTDRSTIAGWTSEARWLPLWLGHVPFEEARKLQREIRAVGAAAQLSTTASERPQDVTEITVLATVDQFRRIFAMLRSQGPLTMDLANAAEGAIRGFTATGPRTIPGVHRSFVVGERTLVMGVVNVTPDSFSDGGKFVESSTAIVHGRRLVAEGADLLDIGGESTRPGATPVSEEEEWRRIGPVVEALSDELHVPISVDTRQPAVATKAIAAGADLVNDVEGLRRSDMRRAVVLSGAPVIVMHMRGDPTTMQAELVYRDLREEVYGFLADSTRTALAEGVSPDRILIDPGLGFGKSPEQSLELLRHLREFRSLGFPLLVGASRKSFLGWALGGAPVDTRAEAGIAAAVLAAHHGADIVRVHDVSATVRALRFADAVNRGRGRGPFPMERPTPPWGATHPPPSDKASEGPPG